MIWRVRDKLGALLHAQSGISLPFANRVIVEMDGLFTRAPPTCSQSRACRRILRQTLLRFTRLMLGLPLGSKVRWARGEERYSG